MSDSSNKILERKKKCYFVLILVLLLYYVLLDQMSDTFMITASSKILSDSSAIHVNTAAFLLMGLQILFSPLQAGFSDFYLRRKSLIVSIIASLVAAVFVKLSMSLGVSFLIIALALKGILGNTLPIAWAGIAECTRGNNIRYALALSICALAVGSWGSLLVVPHLEINIFFIIALVLILFGGLSAIYPFKDSKDAPKPHFLEKMSPLKMLKDECLGIYHIAYKPLNMYALLCFLFSEISFYQILFRIEVFSNYTCFIHVPLAIGIGYTLGTICLKFVKYKDRWVSLLGLGISFLSILILNILFGLNFENQVSFTSFFILYSFGYSFFTPALFSLITPKDHPHLHGKIYGILGSVDGLACLITFIIVFFSGLMTCDFVLLLSSIFMLASAFFFVFVYKLDVFNSKS